MNSFIAVFMWIMLIYSAYRILRGVYHLCKVAGILVIKIIKPTNTKNSTSNSQIEKKSSNKVSVNNKNKPLNDFEKINNLNFYTLRKKLNKVDCKTGVKQLRTLEKKRINFKEIISENLSKDELSYIRCTDQIDNLSLSIINSLQQSYLILKSIITIDCKNNLIQFNRVIKNGNANQILAQEMRLNLWDSQKLKAKKLLFNNEKTLTEIDFLIYKLSTINMEKIDFNSAVEGLNTLNNQYNNSE